MFLIGLCVCVTGCLENGIARLVARRIVSHDDAAAVADYRRGSV